MVFPATKDTFRDVVKGNKLQKGDQNNMGTTVEAMEDALGTGANWMTIDTDLNMADDKSIILGTTVPATIKTDSVEETLDIEINAVLFMTIGQNEIGIRKNIVGDGTQNISGISLIQADSLQAFNDINNSGDYQSDTASKGIILTTPDDTKQYRIRIDNSGNVVTELI